MTAQSSESESFIRASTMTMGWIYFLLWSISFYPQVFKNIRQKSTQGMSPDFPVANTLGLSCYTIYASALLFSPVIRAQYADRHHGHKPEIQYNDLVYGAHAVCIELIVLSQYFPWLWGFRADARQRPSWAMLSLCGACLAYLVGTILWTAAHGHPASPATYNGAWLDVIYAIGNIKILLTTIKYASQARYLQKRQSTVGFAMSAVWMDIIGSLLSLAQLIIDSVLDNDWTGITGNPAKFAIGNVSLLFSFMYVLQHHVLYREARMKAKAIESEDGETEPLISGALR